MFWQRLWRAARRGALDRTVLSVEDMALALDHDAVTDGERSHSLPLPNRDGEGLAEAVLEEELAVLEAVFMD